MAAAFFGLLSRVGLFVALGIPGFLIGKYCHWEKNVYTAFSDVLMYCAMPMLVLSCLLQTDISTLSPLGAALSFLFPFVSVAGILILAHLIFKNADERDVYCFCAAFHNCGFLGIPLTRLLFPEVPAITIYVSIFNMTSTCLLLTVGVRLLGGNKHALPWRRALLSPITFAVAAGVFLSLTGAGQKWTFLATYTDILAAMTTPLSMIVLGAEFAHLSRQSLRLCVNFWMAMALKLVVSPLLTVICVIPLARFGVADTHVAAALLIATAVSTPLSSPAMAEKYGRDGALATVLTAGSAALCMFTLPLWHLIFYTLRRFI